MRVPRIAAAFGAATLIACPAFAQEVVLKVHHFWPAGAMGPTTILAPWCAKIAKESANRMKCQVYPAMQRGGALAVHVHDNGYVHTNPRPVKVMADFKGLRMRAPARQTNKMLAALGATPVAMPLPALAESTSKGVVDGYLLPWEVIPSIKAHELTKYESETDPKSRALYTAVFIFAMNQAKYDSLSPDLKKVINANSGPALSKQMGAQWDASGPPARKLAVELGNTFYVIPAAELEQWQKATRGLADEWVKDVSAKCNDGAALLKSAPDSIARYEKK